MMDGFEGTRIRAEAWPKEVPPIPRPPSVPRMEAVRPLQPPTSRATPPRALTEDQLIQDFARFGPAPTSIWETLAYALHVRARKRALKDELGLLRERRSADVALYEKALRHADEGAVRKGQLLLAIAAAAPVLVIVIVCMLL